MEIKIKNAVKYYEGREVLNIPDLEIKNGIIYAVIGLNGSGKSTLLQCIAGTEKLSEGHIEYEKHLTFGDCKLNISFMAQKPYLFNGTVKNNILIGLKYRKLSKTEIENRFEKYRYYFDMEYLLDKNAKKISGGESAKTALLRTSILEGTLILLDEATSSMDIESTINAEELIKGMRREETTVILVTHDLYQARRMADYVIFMDQGKIIEKGLTENVFNNPQHALVKKMLAI
jgi:tungstate transport system ATP-binding protein